MAAMDVSPPINTDPSYIKYLMENESDNDVYFLVGPENHVERIGALKTMLCAHSEVFRAQLTGSMWAECGDVVIQDILPDTFRQLLKFIYGMDNISEMPFNDANYLLYAAKKYLIPSLVQKLESRLLILVGVENVCDLLNNPACYSGCDKGKLYDKMTEIIQYETKRVTETEAFKNIETIGFVKILEQDILSMSEEAIWTCAIKWAKSKVISGNEVGSEKDVRSKINELKHIRIRTLGYEFFTQEVLPEGVLSITEVYEMHMAYNEGRKPESMEGFSDRTDIRLLSVPLELKIPQCCHGEGHFSCLLLKPQRNCYIKHMVLEFQANDISQYCTKEYLWSCKFMISEFNQLSINSCYSLEFNERVKCKSVIPVPLIKLDGKMMELSPSIKYKFDIMADGFICQIICENKQLIADGFEYFKILNMGSEDYKFSRIRTLKYVKVVDPNVL